MQNTSEKLKVEQKNTKGHDIDFKKSRSAWRIEKDMQIILEEHFMAEENKEIVVIDETTIKRKIYYI